MKFNESHFLLNRRLLLAAAVGSPALALAAEIPVPSGRSESEIANETLVNDFCAAWSKRDVAVLMPYLANDFVYQMFEGRPDLVGAEAFRKEIEPFLAKLASVEWEMLRSYVVGPIVINERIDHFNAPPGGRSMHFQIAGLFVVKNDKIVLWRDYTMPKRA